MNTKFYSLFKNGGGILYCVLCLTFLPFHAFTQVFTKYLSDDQKMADFIPFPLAKEIEYYKQPDIDFKKVLDEDKRKNSSLLRAAVKVEQNYSVSDGLWSQYGDIMVWQIGFSAPKARSLNFLLTELEMPNGSEMYMVSKDGKIIHGAIYPDMIYQKSYASDIIEASDVMIVLRTDIKNAKKFALKVISVCQGIKNSSDLRSFGGSANCHYDVNCPQGAFWEDARDAVVYILRNGEQWCSAALVNNECQDLRGFLLTAFHCLDIDLSTTLSSEEKNLNLYTFRLKYEAGSPLCPGQQTSGGNQGNWFTIPGGAVFSAANNASDFALIELNGSLHHPDIALAGWNRSTSPTAGGATIHHPQGDAKKISKFSTAPNSTTRPNFWHVTFNTGIIEGHSSGSPLFDQNYRIIGQLKGFDVNNQISCANPSGPTFYGRFDLSWTGANTNDTRLSNWLSGSNPPFTTNTIKASWISPWVPNNSQEYVCTTNKLFVLNSPILGRSVSWTVSNPGIFATNGGAATSGTGTNATLRAFSSGATGSAVLTFTQTLNGCNNIILQRKIWVGNPGLPLTSPSGTSPINLGVSAYHTVYLSAAPGTSSFIADWTASGAVSRLGGNFPATYATFTGTYAGTGNWEVNTNNTCGSKSNFGQYNVTTNCNPCPRILVNNPIQDRLVAEIPAYHLPPQLIDVFASVEGEFIMIDQNGHRIKNEIFIGVQHTTDVTDLKNGIYFIKMKNKHIDLMEKVIIIK